MSGEWIKSNWEFGYSYCEYRISMRQAQLAFDLRDAVATMNPQKIEAMAKVAVLFFRPDLVGLEITHLRFTGLQWLVGVAHPSLPKVKDGEQPPILDLGADDDNQLRANEMYIAR